MPVFAPEGGFVLVAARGLALAGLLSVAGTLSFRMLVVSRSLARMTPETRERIERGLRRWLRASAAFAMVGLLAWLVALTQNLAAPDSPGAWIGDLAAVLRDTSFGRVLLLQLALLVAMVPVLGRHPGPARWWGALGLGWAACLAEIGHSHAYAMASGVSALEIAEGLHLWAAAAWLGGLAPLCFVIRTASPAAAAWTARWFSPLGKLCIVLLLLSASLQGVILVGSLDALVHTAYGWTACMKLGLFGVLTAFAALNRYRLAPALLSQHPATARRRLLASVAVQTGFGLILVFVAALLAQLRPGMDMGMPG